jgi:hypothetical protein
MYYEFLPNLSNLIPLEIEKLAHIYTSQVLIEESEKKKRKKRAYCIGIK